MKAKIADQGYLTLTALVKALGMDEGQIKFYQSRSLVSPRNSKQNGHVFSAGDVARLRLIARAKEAGYSINKIESLIGRISPHLSEAAKIKESIDFAGNKFEQMRRDQAAADVLEQINIACDVELLRGYLKDLNASRHERHLNAQKKSPRERTTRPAPKSAPAAAAPQQAAKTLAMPAAGAGPFGFFRKHRFAAIAAGLLAAAGLIFLVSQPAGVKDDHPALTAAKESLETDGAAREVLPENPQDNAADIQADGVLENKGDAPLYTSLPPEPGTAEALPGINPLEEQPVPDLLPIDPTEPLPVQDQGQPAPQAGQLETGGDVDGQSELIKKLISDLQIIYDEQTPRSVAPRQDTQKADPVSDEMKAVADVTASLALVKNNKKDAQKTAAASAAGQDNGDDAAAATEAEELGPSLNATAPQQTADKIEPLEPGVEKPSGAAVSQKPSGKKTPAESAKPPEKKPAAVKAPAVPVVAGAKVSSPTKTLAAAEKKTPAPAAPTKPAQPKQSSKAVTKKPQPPTQTSGSQNKSTAKAPAASRLNLASIDPAALDWAKKSRESYQKGDMSETIVSATVSISIEPDQVQPYIDRALAYKQKGLFDKAIADCNQAMVKDPGSAIAVYTRGVVYQAMGQKQNARIDFARACVMGFVDACDIQTAQLERDSVDTLMKQSRESFRTGDWDAVIAATTDVLKQDPANVTAYVTRSAAYSQKKLFTEAISDCNAALKVDPGYALAYNNRGYAWEQLKKTNEARQDYEKACSLGLKLGCQNYEKF